MCAVDPTRDSDEELRRVCGGDALRDATPCIAAATGGSVAVSVTIAPVCDTAGSIVGTVRITRNVTAFERAERAVRRLARDRRIERRRDHV